MIPKILSNFRSRIFYGWRMIGMVSAIRILGGGLHGYGFTVFFLPVSQDLGLTRAQTSLAYSLSRAEGAIEAPLVGYLVDRFGPRPTIVAAALLTGVGYILLSWVNSYASFLAVYLGVVSLAFTAGFVQSPMVVANSWFIRQRARAMTVVSAAVPVGGALISPVLAYGVTAWGWRWAAFAAGCAFLITCVPLSMRIQRSPESLGLLPDGDPPPQEAVASDSRNQRTGEDQDGLDVTARDAMKTFVYWVFTLSMLARVASHSTIVVHFVPILVWKGLTQEWAALLLGSFAFLNLLAHFVLGWIADRMNKPKLLAICMFIPALSLLALISGQAMWSLWLFTLLFSALDASFPVSWATVGDFFGRKHFGTIRGTMSFFYMWGGALGPIIAGYVYDRAESYISVLWGLVAVLISASFLTALLIKPWKNKIRAARRALVAAEQP
jgi:MFS family permease